MAMLRGQRVSARMQPGDHGNAWVTEIDGVRVTAYATGPGVTIFYPDGRPDLELSRVNDELVIFQDGEAWVFEPVVHGGGAGGGAVSDGSLRAPMPGKIVATPAKPGDTVTKGQPVVVLEALKMEHALVAPFDGVVGEVSVAVGDQVSADTVLATVEGAS
jgi:acetyl/propionyl-CoA carboxylase alpha subunit